MQAATDQTRKAKKHKKNSPTGNKDTATGGKSNKDNKGEPKPKEETFQVTHDGKPDKIIKRKAKPPHNGYVYCYASDKETTLDPKTAEDLIKKSKPKKESLGDRLANIFS